MGRNHEIFHEAYPFLTEHWDDFDQVWDLAEVSGLRVAVMPLLFTGALIIGARHDVREPYLDRWCYTTMPLAITAALNWSGPWPGTEPYGWHRHPASGRRRPHGDPAREYVNL